VQGHSYNAECCAHRGIVCPGYAGGTFCSVAMALN
jgi:hypothetical protein